MDIFRVTKLSELCRKTMLKPKARQTGQTSPGQSRSHALSYHPPLQDPLTDSSTTSSIKSRLKSVLERHSSYIVHRTQ